MASYFMHLFYSGFVHVLFLISLNQFVFGPEPAPGCWARTLYSQLEKFSIFSMIIVNY